MTCVYDTSVQRMLQIDLRGTSSAKTVESADYGKGLVANLMAVLQNAGGLSRWWRFFQNCSHVAPSRQRADMFEMQGCWLKQITERSSRRMNRVLIRTMPTL